MGAVPPYKRTLREFIAEASSDAAGALGGRARASRLADPAAAHAALCHPLLRERWGAAEHRVHPASGVHHIVCTGVPAALEEQRAALARAQEEGRPLQPQKPVKPSRAGLAGVATTVVPAQATASVTVGDLLAAAALSDEGVAACAPAGRTEVPFAERSPLGGPIDHDRARHPGCVLAIVDRDANVVFQRLYSGFQPPT